MNFDEFVEKLKAAFPDVDWFVEHPRFKYNSLVEAQVVFNFRVPSKDEEE